MAAPQPEEVRRTAIAIALGVLLGMVLRIVNAGRRRDAGGPGDPDQPSSGDSGSK